MFVALLKLSWFIRGSFFFLLGKGWISVCSRRKRRRKSDFFSVFPLQLRRESLFICLPLTLCHSSFPFHERSRIFGCSSPGFLPGGFSVSVEGVSFFCFSLAIGEEIRILVALLLSGINVFKRAGRETRNAS